MASDAVLYEIAFPNGKVYFGITNNFAARMSGHKCTAKKGVDAPLYRAIRKFGWEATKRRILARGERELILLAEQEAIAKFRTDEFGYNLTPGGDFCPSLVPAIAKRAGEKKRNRPLSEEHKAALSEAWKRRAPPSDETRKKISAAGRGRVFAPEVIERIAAKNRGRQRTPEQRAAISAAKRNVPPPSQEARQRMSESAKRAWALRKTQSGQP